MIRTIVIVAAVSGSVNLFIYIARTAYYIPSTFLLAPLSARPFSAGVSVP